MPAFLHARPQESGEAPASELLAQRLSQIEGLMNQPSSTEPEKPMAPRTPDLAKEPSPTAIPTKEIPEIAKLEVQKPETPAPNGNAADATTWQDISKTSFS